MKGFLHSILVFMFFYIFQYHKISKGQKKSRTGEIERQRVRLVSKRVKLALVLGAYDLNFLTTLSKLDTML